MAQDDHGGRQPARRGAADAATHGDESRIEQRRRRALLRWCLLPVAAIGSCGAAGIASGVVVTQLRAWFGAAAVELAVPLDAQHAMRYFLEAFAFVAAGTFMAPRARSIVSLALLAAGGWLAWEFLRWWYFPEFHMRSYEVSPMPLWGTWLGGLSAVIVLRLPSVRRALTTVRH